MALLIRLAALVGAAAAYSVVPPRQAARAPLQMWQDDLAAATR